MKADKAWNEIVSRVKKFQNDNLHLFDVVDEVILFGAGFHGMAAKRYLERNNVKVVSFVDNDANKQGVKIESVPVHDLSWISNSPCPVLITARHAVKDVLYTLNENQLTGFSFDAYFIVKNIDRIAFVRNSLLHDKVSRESYDAIIMTMLTGNNVYLRKVINDKQYFALPEFVTIGNDHFVDAGAYVGDTLERFIWMNNGVFKHIYAFEPGKQQYLAAQSRIKRLCSEWAIDETKIDLVHSGLGDVNGRCSITYSGDMLQSASISSGELGHEQCNSHNVDVCTLDSYLNGRPVSFIKADIEGSEMAMLRGAQNAIRTCKPKMALSVYHEPTDLYAIAEYVHELVPEYTIALRHHSPTLMESVLYCFFN